jgi:hypothetical protein
MRQLQGCARPSVPSVSQAAVTRVWDCSCGAFTHGYYDVHLRPCRTGRLELHYFMGLMARQSRAAFARAEVLRLVTSHGFEAELNGEVPVTLMLLYSSIAAGCPRVCVCVMARRRWCTTVFAGVRHAGSSLGEVCCVLGRIECERHHGASAIRSVSDPSQRCGVGGGGGTSGASIGSRCGRYGGQCAVAVATGALTIGVRAAAAELADVEGAVQHRLGVSPTGQLHAECE